MQADFDRWPSGVRATIRQARLKREISIREMSEKLGLKYDTYRRMEAGYLKIKPQTAAQISQLLGLDLPLGFAKEKRCAVA